MKRYIVLEVDGDEDFLSKDQQYLQECLNEALAHKDGPIRGVELAEAGDLFWEFIYDGVSQYAPEVYDDRDEPVEDRAQQAFDEERDSILGDGRAAASWLGEFWDSEIPEHLLRKLAAEIKQADEEGE